ncbi:MAG: START domain-containing protein [Minicystis sp.]
MRPSRTLLVLLSTFATAGCYATVDPAGPDALSPSTADALSSSVADALSPSVADALSPSAAVTAAAPGPTTAPSPESTLLAEGFVLLSDEHGVKVYRREKRPGLELAGVGDLAAPPAQVRRVLIDYPNHKRWQKYLAENKILAQSPNDLFVYQRLSLPVIDDRDFTLHVTWGSEGDVLWMRFASAPDRGPPPVPGVVRVTEHDGGWRLEAREGGKVTHGVYRFHLDLAGSVPTWLGKGGAAEDVARLFQNIDKQLPLYR